MKHLERIRGRPVGQVVPNGLDLPSMMDPCRLKLQGLIGPRLWVHRQYRPRPLKLDFGSSGKIAAPNLSFSIVTPSFQQGPFIARAIQSVLEQGYPHLEYCVQDGGSTDSTVDVLSSFGHRLKFETAPDQGQADAINRAFANASGDIMGWLNSDDMLLPGALQAVAAFFADNEDVDLVYGHRIYIDTEDRDIGRCVVPSHKDGVLSWADIVPQETMFWRRRLWEKTGGLDPAFHFAMDWDFLLRARASGAKMATVNRFLGCFRVHERQKNRVMMNTVGRQEMAFLRRRELGFSPGKTEIRMALARFFQRQLAADLAWRLGLSRIE